MRNVLLLLAASAAIATPAAARDGQAYIGVDAGMLFSAKDMSVDELGFAEGGLIVTAAAEDFTDFDLDSGRDINVVGGYDFGVFRIEAELAHKRANGGEITVDSQTQDTIELNRGSPLTDDDMELGGGVKILSLMANALLDIGGNEGVGASFGAGLGRAKVDSFGDSDSAWAGQLVAAARIPLARQIEAGIKYRYFRTGKVHYESEDVNTGGPFSFSGGSRFRSHSILASLTYNFGS